MRAGEARQASAEFADLRGAAGAIWGAAVLAARDEVRAGGRMGVGEGAARRARSESVVCEVEVDGVACQAWARVEAIAWALAYKDRAYRLDAKWEVIFKRAGGVGALGAGRRFEMFGSVDELMGEPCGPSFGSALDLAIGELRRDPGFASAAEAVELGSCAGMAEGGEGPSARL